MTTISTARRRSRQPSPSPVVFADTVYWTGLVRERDQHRRRVLLWQEWVEEQGLGIVTTEAVLWEFVNGCSHPTLRHRTAELYRFCQQQESIEIVSFKPARIEAAVTLHESRPDKEWSLTDCLSFVVMQARGLTAALTTDHHFQQAGFQALLLEDPPTR